MAMHATLLQQLRQALGIHSPSNLQAALTPLISDAAGDPAAFASKLSEFVALVEGSYRQFERAQELRLRSLSESAGELTQANARLREESQRQRHTIDSMLALVNRLQLAAGQVAVPPGEQSAERLIEVAAQLVADGERARERLV